MHHLPHHNHIYLPVPPYLLSIFATSPHPRKHYKQQEQQRKSRTGSYSVLQCITQYTLLSKQLYL